MSFRAIGRSRLFTTQVVRATTLLVALAIAPSAHALFWDQDSNLGGDGTWDVNTTQNWRTTNTAGAPDSKWFPNDGTQDANFNGPGTANYTVTIPAGTTINANFLGFGILSSPATTARNVTVTGGQVINISNPNSSIVMNTNTQGIARAQVLASPISGTNITVVANAGSINSFLTLGANATGATNTFTGDLLFAGSGTPNGNTFSQININNPTALPSTATVRMKRDYCQLFFTAGGFSGTNGYTATFNNNIILNDGIVTPALPFQSIGAAAASTVVTLGGVISGNSDLLFRVGANGGNGQFILTNHSTYTGSTYMLTAAGGAIHVGINDALPTTTTFTFGGNTTNTANVGALNLNGFNQKLAGLASTTTNNIGGVTNTSGTTSTLTIDGNVNGIYRGNIGLSTLAGSNDNLALVLASTNTGTLTLNNTFGNSYTGGTTINGGKLIAANDPVSFPSGSGIGSGAVAVNNGGTLGGGGSVGGIVTVASGGHIAPSGVVGTTGSSNIGTLTASAGTSLGSGSRLDIDLGAPAPSGGTSDQLKNGAGVTVPAAASSIGVNLSDPAGGAAGNGTYTLVTFPTGQYTGSNNASQFFTASLPSPNSLNGATIAYHLADDSLANQDGNVAAATRVIMTVSGGPNALLWTGAASGTWDTSAANFNNIGTGATGVAFAGNDNVTFDDTGSNTTVAVAAGGVQPNVVTINNSTATYTFSGGDIKGSSIGGGGGLVFAGTGAATINNSYTAAGPIVSNKTGTGAATINGVISAATGVTVNGGTFTLAGANTYAGNNTINGGTLTVGADNNLGAVPGSPTANSIVIAGGTLATMNSFTLSSNRSITANATSSAISNAAGTTLTYGGVISGSGGLTQTGGGTLLLTGNSNSYAGATSVVGGASGSTLKIGVDNALPTGTQLNLNGVAAGGNATFDLNGFNQTVGAIALTGPTGAGGTITNSAAGSAKTFTVNNSTTRNFGGVISGNLNFVKNGSGSLTLTGANAYTGDTKDLGGTLSIASAYLADAADVYLATGSIFNLNFAGTDTIRSLFIDGLGQATGTWGGSGSGAAHITSLITGTGLLNVTSATSLPGDYNNDGKVDAADYVMWRKNPGAFGGDAAGYTTWRQNFGNPPGSGSGLSGSAVPEPASLIVGLGMIASMLVVRRRKG